MALIAHRGGTPLADEIERKAHLVSLLRLENVGAVLGAGASASAGGSTMKATWSDFVWMSPVEASWLIANCLVSAAERVPALPRPTNAPLVVPPLTLPPGMAPPPSLLPMTPNIEVLTDKLEIAIIEWEGQGNALATPAKNARGDCAGTVQQLNFVPSDFGEGSQCHPSRKRVGRSAGCEAHRRPR